MTSKRKFCIIGDCHFGARNDSELFMNHFFDFYTNVLFPYIIENDVTDIIQTGDFMDKRKNINYRTLNRVMVDFMDKLRSHGVTLHVIPGNHDIFHRHSNSINSINELFGWMENVNVYMEPTTITILETKIDMIPWMNKYNTAEILEFIKASTSQYCVGHFEVIGFDMAIGIPGHGGMDTSIFDSYDEVWSGHYHTRSKKDNITYVGTPYEITWSDFNDPKGFHSFDPNRNELTFHENRYRIFHKVFYSSELDYDDFDFDELRNSIIKVIIQDHADIAKYENFLDRLESVNPADMSIVESDIIVASGIDEEELETLDTFTVLRTAATNVARVEGLNEDKMLKYVNELYSEAVSIGRDS